MTSTKTHQPRSILLVSQFFDPEPAFKGLAFARALRDRGHSVEVLTGFPNYPSGSIYPGYKLSLFKYEHLDGIRIARVFLYPSRDKSRVARSMNYISFFLTSLIYLLFFARSYDLIYAYHPPATTGLSVAIARVFRRTPTVLDVQDLWPDTLSSTGMVNNRTVLRLIGSVCKWTYKRVDHIVVLSPGFKRLLLQRGVPDRSLTVIRNWADEVQVISCDLPVEMTDPHKFKVLFSGNIGEAQGLEAVLKAAEILKAKNPKISILLLGSGVQVEELKQLKEERSLSNVHFLPRVPVSAVGNYMLSANCLLVHLKSDPLFEVTIPSKTQAYLAAGRPILMAVPGDAADLVTEAKAGILAKSGDPDDIARRITELSHMDEFALSEMGSNGRSFYLANLSIERGVAQFESVFEGVLKKRFGEQ